ncbi:hypothetical protein AB0K46_22560, partial [Streptomyces cinnamoneus]
SLEPAIAATAGFLVLNQALSGLDALAIALVIGTRSAPQPRVGGADRVSCPLLPVWRPRRWEPIRVRTHFRA